MKNTELTVSCLLVLLPNIKRVKAYVPLQAGNGALMTVRRDEVQALLLAEPPDQLLRARVSRDGTVLILGEEK